MYDWHWGMDIWYEASIILDKYARILHDSYCRPCEADEGKIEQEYVQAVDIYIKEVIDLLACMDTGTGGLNSSTLDGLPIERKMETLDPYVAEYGKDGEVVCSDGQKMRAPVKPTKGTARPVYTKNVDVVKGLIYLYDQYPELVKAKQASIAKNGYALQYAVPHTHANMTDSIRDNGGNPSINPLRGDGGRSPLGAHNEGRSPLDATFVGQSDAFDIIIDNSMRVHSGLASHGRRGHYMLCPDRSVKEAYYVDFCISTNSSVDIRED